MDRVEDADTSGLNRRSRNALSSRAFELTAEGGVCAYGPREPIRAQRDDPTPQEKILFVRKRLLPAHKVTAMKKMRLVLSLLGLHLVGTACHAEELEFKHMIDKTMKCDNPSGNEIKEVAHASAPAGKVFEKDSIKVITERQTRSYTGAAGPSTHFPWEVSHDST